MGDISFDEALKKIENKEPVFLKQSATKILTGEQEFMGQFFYMDTTNKVTGEGYYTHGKWCVISIKTENGISTKKAGGRHMIKIYDNIFGIKRKSRTPYWERPIINEGN